MKMKRILSGLLAGAILFIMSTVESAAAELYLKETVVQTEEGEHEGDNVAVQAQDVSVIGLEFQNTDQNFDGIYPYGVLYCGKRWHEEPLSTWELRLKYSDGTTGDWVSYWNWENFGISTEVRDTQNPDKPEEDSLNYLPKGQYEIIAKLGNVSTKVMDVQVKSMEECQSTTWDMLSLINIDRNKIVKFTVTEKAVYQFGMNAQDERDTVLTICDSEGETIRLKNRLNKENDAKFYLNQGTYYIHGFRLYGKGIQLSVKKKEIATVEAVQLPTIRQRIIKQNEINAIYDMWYVSSKLHDNMKFKLTYKDGTSDIMEYREYGALHNFTDIIAFYDKNGDKDFGTNDPGVYYEEIMFEDEGYDYWYNPLARVKFYVCPEYSDVKESDWFYDPACIVSAEGIMTGTSETTFEPGKNLERGQFASIIYRLEGSQAVSYSSVFKDVPDGQWYTKPVLWASSAGIVKGYTNGNYGPADEINREQMALMMYRYAGKKGFDTKKRASLSHYLDANSVSDFATEAMQWCVAEGIITGKDGGTRLAPKDGASRAECASIMKRFIEKYQL